MIFTLLERLMIPSFLPREGNFLDMNSSDHLLKAVRFDPEEMERARDPEGLNLRPNDQGGMAWENEFAEDYSKDIDLSIDQAALLRKELVKLNDEEKLPRDMLSLYKKIVIDDLTVKKRAPELQLVPQDGEDPAEEISQDKEDSIFVKPEEG